jgi:arsenite methyltransferase
MAKEETFFDFAATVGLTKHLGGIEATDRMAELCRITKDSFVLDVGCGVGQTACYLAEKIGCRVAGVDIKPAMVARSQERAKKTGLDQLTEFKTADAQELPYPDETFDAVITESVTAFPQDKLRAVREYTRVTKPGGFIGLNESTWLKLPPPPEMIAWVSQDIGATVNPLSAEEWTTLLKDAGLELVLSDIQPVDPKVEAKGIVARYGLGSILRTTLRAGGLYLRNANYRKFLKEVNEGGITPENITEYFGYGMYIGKKPE